MILALSYRAQKVFGQHRSNCPVRFTEIYSKSLSQNAVVTISQRTPDRHSRHFLFVIDYFLNICGCKDKKKFRFPPREKRIFLCMNINFNISRAQGNIRYARYSARVKSSCLRSKLARATWIRMGSPNWYLV